MLKANFITAQEAAEKIQDGSILCTIGMTLVSASESILKAIERDLKRLVILPILLWFIPVDRVIEKMEFSIWRTKGLSRELLDPIGVCNRDGWR